jgi:hypothetical protein
MLQITRLVFIDMNESGADLIFSTATTAIWECKQCYNIMTTIGGVFL